MPFDEAHLESLIEFAIRCRNRCSSLDEVIHLYKALASIADHQIPVLSRRLNVESAMIRGLVMVSGYVLKAIDRAYLDYGTVDREAIQMLHLRFAEASPSESPDEWEINAGTTEVLRHLSTRDG